MDALTATHSRLRRVTGLLLLSSGAWLGCSGDTTGPALVPATQLFWALHLNWNAATLALATSYNTVQLTTTAVNEAGAALTGDTAVRYRAVDSTVTVSATGLVTAQYVTSRTQVIATLTVNGATLMDTVQIRVTPTPLSAPLATLSIQPQPDGLDSAKVSVSSYYNINQFNGNIPVYATDTQGQELCDLYSGCPFLVAFQSSDPNVATLDRNGYLTALTIGHVTFSASAYVYGVGKRDSLPFAIEYPTAASAIDVVSSSLTHLVPYLKNSGSIIGVGGWMTFYNQLSQDVVITFPYQTRTIFQPFVGPETQYQLTDTIAGGGTGSGPTFQFDSAGSYTFHCTILGTTNTTVDGTVNVRSGP